MPATDYKPTPDGLAKILASRTADEHGDRQGRFTTTTTPTLAEVTEYIDRALTTVSARIGVDIPPEFFAAARGVVELRAAMWVELGGVAADADDEDESGYARYEKAYDGELASLLSAIRAGAASSAAEPGIVSVRASTGVAEEFSE